MTGGITNTFSYKEFSLRVFIQTFQGAMHNNAIYNNADQSGSINLPEDVVTGRPPIKAIHAPRWLIPTRIIMLIPRTPALPG